MLIEISPDDRPPGCVRVVSKVYDNVGGFFFQSDTIVRLVFPWEINERHVYNYSRPHLSGMDRLPNIYFFFLCKIDICQVQCQWYMKKIGFSTDKLIYYQYRLVVFDFKYRVSAHAH